MGARQLEQMVDMVLSRWGQIDILVNNAPTTSPMQWVADLDPGKCNTRLRHGGCSQKSARLDIYEAQLQDYLEAFHVPEDYQQMLVDAQRRLAVAYDDTEAQRRWLDLALERRRDGLR